MTFSLIQYALFLAFGLALAATLRRGSHGVISRTETMLWSALWIVAAVVVARPEVTSRFAAFVGVGRGVDAVVYASVAALFYLIFRVYVRIDRLERDITSIVRREALDHHKETSKDNDRA